MGLLKQHGNQSGVNARKVRDAIADRGRTVGPRPASVLGSSRFRRLKISLGIGATGSSFRTRASHWSHAVFMPVAARPVGRLPPSFVPDQQLEPGFGDVPTLSDTSSTVQSSSSSGLVARPFPRDGPQSGADGLLPLAQPPQRSPQGLKARSGPLSLSRRQDRPPSTSAAASFARP